MSGELECPCCGWVAASGIMQDGQDLDCGCNGWISLDAETAPYVVIGDLSCDTAARCEDPE